MIGVVSGHEGFIGRRLIQELKAMGFAAHGLQDSDGRAVDLLDRAGIDAVIRRLQPDIVFHLGGISGPMLSLDNPAAIIDVNCAGTLNVLESARRLGVKSLVYASSVAASAFGTAADPLPDSLYGATKRFGEILAAHFARTTEMATTSVRIGSVFGSGRVTSNPFHAMARAAVDSGRVEYETGLVEPCIAIEDCARLLAGLGGVERPRDYYDAVAYLPTHEDVAALIVELIGADRVALRRRERPTYPRGFDIGPLVADTGVSVEISLRAGITSLVEAARASREVQVG